MAPTMRTSLPTPHEQRKIEALLLRLEKLKLISAKPNKPTQSAPERMKVFHST
jgi:hypothetical protein